MNKKTLITRPDGTRYEIYVSIRDGVYSYTVHVCEKGKRKFRPILNGDDYTYRRCSFPDGRKEYELNLYAKHVTPDEILTAKLNLWNSLKPTL